MIKGQIQHFALGGRYEGYVRMVVPLHHEGFSEDFILLHISENCLTTPDILFHHMDGSLQNDTDVLYGLFFHENDFSFVMAPSEALHASHQFLHVFRGDILEQRGT